MTYNRIDLLVNLIVVIILQCIHIPKYHITHLNTIFTCQVNHNQAGENKIK